jgi:hypothetical protein
MHVAHIGAWKGGTPANENFRQTRKITKTHDDVTESLFVAQV